MYCILLPPITLPLQVSSCPWKLLVSSSLGGRASGAAQQSIAHMNAGEQTRSRQPVWILQLRVFKGSLHLQSPCAVQTRSLIGQKMRPIVLLFRQPHPSSLLPFPPFLLSFLPLLGPLLALSPFTSITPSPYPGPLPAPTHPPRPSSAWPCLPPLLCSLLSPWPKRLRRAWGTEAWAKKG